MADSIKHVWSYDALCELLHMLRQLNVIRNVYPSTRYGHEFITHFTRKYGRN